MIEEIFDKDVNEVFDACRQALEKLDFSIETADKQNSTITASAGTSFFSWGEDIQVILERAEGKVEVKVESSSKAQLIDWGRNSDNEEKIMDEIKSILES